MQSEIVDCDRSSGVLLGAHSDKAPVSSGSSAGAGTNAYSTFTEGYSGGYAQDFSSMSGI